MTRSAQAERLREMAHTAMQDTPPSQINVWLLETVEALRAGAAAIEWVAKYQQEMVEIHGGTGWKI